MLLTELNEIKVLLMQFIVIETQSQLSPKTLPTETSSAVMPSVKMRNNIVEALLSELVDHLAS